MSQYDFYGNKKPKIIMVTPTNIPWAAEVSGYTEDEIRKFLVEAIENEVVCTVTCKERN